MQFSLIALWAAIKQITVYQVIVAAISVGTFIAPAYYFVKPIAVAQAGQAIKNLMKQEGIDPEKIKNLPEQVGESLKAQTRIESDLASVKAQQQQLIDLLSKTLKQPALEPQQ